MVGDSMPLILYLPYLPIKPQILLPVPLIRPVKDLRLRSSGKTIKFYIDVPLPWRDNGKENLVVGDDSAKAVQISLRRHADHE